MVPLKEEGREELLRIVRVGGYLVIGGILMGATFGVYALLNRVVFSALINISQYEATGFFLGVCLPSFVITAAVGYMFATMPRLEIADLWRATTLSVLSLLCLVLSSLSLFNLLSFVGGFLALTAVIAAYTKPTFRALSRREACFLVQTGAMLVASFSTLFLLMWFLSRFFPTYSTGLFGAGSYYLNLLLMMQVMSFLMFFAVPFLCFQDTNTGLCGGLGLIISIALSVMAVKNRYVYFNASVYLGVFMVAAGIISSLVGALTYLKLFSSSMVPPTIPTPSVLYLGRYCPYCGEMLADLTQNFCASCGRRPTWRQGAPFCPYCGRVVPNGVRTCPHCHEALG